MYTYMCVCIMLCMGNGMMPRAAIVHFELAPTEKLLRLRVKSALCA